VLAFLSNSASSLSKSGYIASADGMVSEEWIVKYVEGSVCSVTRSVNQKVQSKTSKTLSG
jgi:hypothetical protein